MIKILICGVNGKMGQMICATAANKSDIEICCGVDLFADSVKNDFPVYENFNECKEVPDVIIDFSRPDAVEGNLKYSIKNNVPVVIATTGLAEQHKEMLRDAAKSIPVFFSANFSLGVNLQMELAKKAAEFLGESFDIEIVEKHHNQKADSPSGTALAIAEHIDEAFEGEKDFVYGRHSMSAKRGNEIGIHAVRGGTIVGEHTVIFAGVDEVIEIKHTAYSKQVFASGALRAARFIVGKPAGMYGMNDMI